MFELPFDFVLVALTAFLGGLVVGAIAFLTIAVSLLERATRSVSVAVPASDRLEPSRELLDGLQRLQEGTPLPGDLPVVELPPAAAEPSPAVVGWRFEPQDGIPRQKRCGPCEAVRAWFARARRPTSSPSGS